MKNQVPALHPLSGLTPAPGEIVDPHLGMSLPGNKVSNICWLLDSLSWVVDERVTIQRNAGLNENDYMAAYRQHFRNKMDISIFSNPSPRKLPQAPRRLHYISSYRSSLRSLHSVGYIPVRTGRGRFSSGQIRIGGAPKSGPSASSKPGDRSPEI